MVNNNTNNKDKFTPGPWTVVRLKGRTSFRIYHPETTSEEAAKANARLIASAPMLLDALECIFSNAAESPDWIRAKIGPIIAKARGETFNVQPTATPKD